MNFERNKRIYKDKTILELRSRISSEEYKINKNIPKFIFLCGKDINSGPDSNRSLIEEFYKKIKRDDVFCLYADYLWRLDKLNIDLLTYEDFLAELSDGIILFLESYGTACELGAFSMKDELISKMLVFIDKQYQTESSFINEGPIKKIITEKDMNVTYVDLNAIFSNMYVFEKLKKLVKPQKIYINRDKERVRVNSFIIELLELLFLLEPIKLKELINIYKLIKGFENFNFSITENNSRAKNIEVRHIVSLLIKSELIISNEEYLRINISNFKFPNFMFELTNFQLNKIKTEIIARKYRYRDGIVI